MSTEIRIPQLGAALDEVTLVEWLVADGSSVVEGTAIFSIETEKSAVEVPAPASGTLQILAAAGEQYAIGVLVARIE